MTPEQQAQQQAILRQRQHAAMVRKKTMAIINLVLRTYGVNPNDLLAKQVYNIVVNELNRTSDTKIEWMYANIKQIIAAGEGAP